MNKPGEQNTVGAGTDTLSGFENLTGSRFNDKLAGDSADNLIMGGLGDDVLDGAGGTDTLSYADVKVAAGDPNPQTGVSVALHLTAAQNTVRAGSDTLSHFENLQGSLYDDILTGSDGHNRIEGLAGDDILEGGQGNDLLIGGAGRDTASYAGASDGVTVNLGAVDASGKAVAENPVSAGSDTLEGIENLIGSPFSDDLTGDDHDNLIMGGAGNDQLFGAAGDDTLEGGLGNDQLNGGTGRDAASYADVIVSATDPNPQTGVTVKLETLEKQDTIRSGEDALAGIEDLIGSDYNDVLTGDGAENSLYGRSGDDQLYGRDGADYLFGGGGKDTLNGEAGNDWLEGGAGNDTLTGGAGSDTASYMFAQAGVTVDLSNPADQETGGAGTDRLLGMENLYGSALNDTLTGNTEANVLTGGAGDDTLIGGRGSDILRGGLGSDTVSYEGETESVVASLADGEGRIAATGHGDTFTGIENLTGGSGADILTGDAYNNLLRGGVGDDQLFGGSGDDILEGGGGSDELYGEAGKDTASYANDPKGVTVDLTGTATDGFDNRDTLSGIENLSGSAGNDTLIGDGSDNYLYGGAGDDHLQGAAGDDLLEGGAGSDTLTGGAGSDTASYANDPKGVTVALGGAAQDGFGHRDVFEGMENLLGSQYADTLIGDSGDNILYGGGGDDTLRGGGGNDIYAGGIGADTYDYSGAIGSLSIYDPENFNLAYDLLVKGSITIVSGGTLTINQGVTVSSRTVASGDYLNGGSTGDSGHISLQGQNLVLEPGAKLLAHAIQADGSSYKAGNITLYAKDTSQGGIIGDLLGPVPNLLKDFIAPVYLPLDFEASSVTITDAVIQGAQVGISADAGQQKLVEDKGAGFKPAAVDGVSNSITFSKPHGFNTGDAVLYSAGEGGTAVGGLASGETYSVVVIDAETVKLAATSAEALAADPKCILLDPSVAAGEEHKLTKKTDILGTIAEVFGGIDSLFSTNLLPSFDICPLALSIAGGTIDLSGENTLIDADSLTLTATALSHAKVDIQGFPILNVGVAIAVPTARVNVNSGVDIVTTGDMAVNAVAESTVEATAKSDGEWFPFKAAGWFATGLQTESMKKSLKDNPFIKALGYIPKVSVGVGVGVAEATSMIASGSTLNVGGSLTVGADIAKKQEVGSEGKGRFAFGVSVSVFSGTATAAVDGTVSADRDVSVTAGIKTDDNKVEAGSEFEPEKPDEGEPAATPEKKPYNPRDYYSNYDAFMNGNGVDVKLIKRNQPRTHVPGHKNESVFDIYKSDSSGNLITDQEGKLIPKTDTRKKQEEPKKPGSSSGLLDELSLSGAAAISVHTNISLARIGDHATVASEHGNVLISATTDDTPKITADSEIKGVNKEKDSNKEKQTALGGSIVFGFLLSQADALIGEGAQVDAPGSISIQSNTSIAWKEGYSGIVGSLSEAASKGLAETAGALPALNIGTTVQSALKDWKDGYLGAKGNLFSTWARSSGESDGFAGQGTADVLILINKSHATIDENAKVNQLAIPSSDQDVLIKATSDMATVNLSGVIPGGGLGDFIDPFGGKAAGGGGLSLLVGVNYNDVAAEIRKGALVTGETLAVLADTTAVSVAVAPVSSKAEKASLSGSLSLDTVINLTKARIDGDAVVETGSKTLESSGATLLVEATDTTVAVNTAGSAAFGKAAGVGLAGAVNVVYRDTEAQIGDPDDTARGSGSVASGGNIAVKAANDGFTGAFSAVVSGSQPVPDSVSKGADDFSKGIQEKLKQPIDFIKNLGRVIKTPVTAVESLNQLLHKGGWADYQKELAKVWKTDNPEAKKEDEKLSKWGVQFSGNISANIGIEAAEARIANATILSAAGVALNGANNTVSGAAAGSAAASWKSEEGSAGIGVSLAANVVVGKTEASIDNSSLTMTGDLNLASTTLGVRGALAASGALSGKEKGFAVGLSSATLVNVQETLTYISDSIISGVKNVTLDATDTSITGTVAGSLVYTGGAAGVGPAIATTVLVNSIQSYIEDCSMTSTGNMVLTSRNTSVVGSLAAAGAISSGGIAAPISVATNTIVSETVSTISATDRTDDSLIKADGDILVNATDTSMVGALAGNVGIGIKGGKNSRGAAAAGASISVNTLVHTVDSSIRGSRTGLDDNLLVVSGKNLEVSALNNAFIGNLAVGGQGAEKFAIGGSVAVNTLVYDTDASIEGAQVLARENGTISATDGSVVLNLAGTGQGAEKAAVGAAIAVDTVVGSTTARVENSSVNRSDDKGKNLNVSALRWGALATTAVAGQGAKEWAVGGSFAVGTVVTTTEAGLTDSAAYVSNDIALSSLDASGTLSGAGAFQGSGKGAVGVAFSVYTLVSSLEATAEDSDLWAGHDIRLNAKNIAVVGNLAVAGQGAKEYAIGGSVAVNTLVSTTRSLITGSTLWAGNDVALDSHDVSVAGAAAGAIQGAGTAAVGLAVAVNSRVGTVTGGMEESTVLTSHDVHLHTTNAAVTLGLAAAGQGAGKFAVGGSVVVNTLVGISESYLLGSNIRATNDVAVTALDVSVIGAYSGAFQGAQNLAAGAAIAVNTLVRDLSARVEGSTLQADGNIAVEAGNVGVVAGMAAGVQGSGGFSLGGSVAVNTLTGTTLAKVGKSAGGTASTLSAGGDVSVTALDVSAIAALSGSVKIAQSAAIGAAVTVNTIVNPITAGIEGSTLCAAGSIRLDAQNVSVIGSLAVGGQFAQSAAFGGSVAFNQIVNVTSASVVDSNLYALGNISLDADNVSVIANQPARSRERKAWR